VAVNVRYSKMLGSRWSIMVIFSGPDKARPDNQRVHICLGAAVVGGDQLCVY